jgi:hypothetical protein
MIRGGWAGSFAEMETIVSTLNTPLSRYAELRRELRALVEDWIASGPNMIILSQRLDPKLRKRIFARTASQPAPMPGPNIQVTWLARPKGYNENRQKDRAIACFMELIRNPYAQRLGGPCKRCGAYYLKKTRAQKTFCSRNCSSSFTAISSTKNARAAERQRKLKTVRSALKHLPKFPRPGRDWKRWIAEKAKVSLHWLTRAINQGEIDVPKDLVGFSRRNVN